MAGPPMWIHTAFGFFGAAFSILFTYLMSKILYRAFGTTSQPGLPPAPHMVSMCYDPAQDVTTIQYSNGEQFVVSGAPASWGCCAEQADPAPTPLSASPGEPLTTDGFRQLLDRPGEGPAVVAGKVQFNQEGGFREN